MFPVVKDRRRDPAKPENQFEIDMLLVSENGPDEFLFVPAKDFVKLRGRVENFGKCGCQFKVSSDNCCRIPSIEELFKKINF